VPTPIYCNLAGQWKNHNEWLSWILELRRPSEKKGGIDNSGKHHNAIGKLDA
jgi:hypothetical protein